MILTLCLSEVFIKCRGFCSIRFAFGFPVKSDSVKEFRVDDLSATDILSSLLFREEKRRSDVSIDLSTVSCSSLEKKIN